MKLKKEMSKVFIASILLLVVAFSGCVETVGPPSPRTFTIEENNWLAANEIEGPAVGAAELVKHGISLAWEFTNNKEEMVDFHLQVPSTINLSYDITFSIGWSSSVTSQNCNWNFTYITTQVDEDTTKTFEFGYDTFATSSATADGFVVTEFNLTGDIVANDLCIHASLLRDGNDVGDTINGDVHLHGVCLTYYEDVTRQ
jgi:hypothetical protein